MTPIVLSARRGADALPEIVKSKKPILDFYFDHYSEKQAMKTIQGKQVFIKQVMPHVEAIKDNH